MCDPHYRMVPEKVRIQMSATRHRDVAAFDVACNRAVSCVSAELRPLPDRPVLFIGHPSSPRSHGGGTKWCGMGLPRTWEQGEGRVETLAPDPQWVRSKKQGDLDARAYRDLYVQRLHRHAELGQLVPGVLCAKPWSSEAPFLTRALDSVVVESGDTVWCACGKDKAHEGRCHLSWAVPYLLDSGWRVQMFDKRFPATPSAEPQLDLFGAA